MKNTAVIIRLWPEHVARMQKRKNAYTILAGKPEGKISLGRFRYRWQGNIKMDLSKI
jgi:hypothetical protein